MKYRAFLSYSHADRKWARWLHRKLESYRPPVHLKGPGNIPLPRSLGPIFRDRDELATASNLSDAVEGALIQSESLIVICSPNAVASRWVDEEIRYFRKLGRSDKIFCFVVGGEPASRDENECFPRALIEPETSGEPSAEPVAADARRGGDGRTNAMLKVVAGVLGVGFDALRKRDTRRRHRRLVVVAAGSLILSAFTIVLAVNAVIARNEAQERRTQAEDLIDFMLGDLRAQLRKIGRLDVFQSVGDKALEYFAAQSDADDSLQTLTQRANNLRQIGEVRREQGNLDAALEAFEESMQIAEIIADRDAGNVEAQIGLVNSRFYVGYVHWQRGELEIAKQIFEQNISIVDFISAGAPDDTKRLTQRAYAHTNLGRVLELEGSYEKALRSYGVVMEINQRLMELEPENHQWLMELGFAHNNLGKLLYPLGHLDEAESHFRSDLEIKRRIYEADPEHNVQRSYLGVSLYYLGQLLVARGVYEEALFLLSEAQEHFNFLVNVDPDRLAWRARLANTQREVATLYGISGQWQESYRLLEASKETLQELVDKEKENPSFHRDLVRSQLTLADFAARNGDENLANNEANDARALLDALLNGHPSVLESIELLVFSEVCAAHLAPTNSAKVHLNQALQILDQSFAESRDPRIIELRASVLAGLGDVTSAGVLRKQLHEMGFSGRKLELREKWSAEKSVGLAYPGRAGSGENDHE